jgi:hypothetical protein
MDRMSREDLLNEIICQECGHSAHIHGLAQCYGDDQKCKCSNKLGILIAVLEEDANWAGCELLEDTQNEREEARTWARRYYQQFQQMVKEAEILILRRRIDLLLEELKL